MQIKQYRNNKIIYTAIYACAHDTHRIGQKQVNNAYTLDSLFY